MTKEFMDAAQIKERLLNKKRVLTLQLDSKTHYGLELLARKQRRNVSGVVHAWIQAHLASDLIESDGTNSINLLDLLWSHNDADRLLRLSLIRPGLLTYKENCLMESIRESSQWKECYQNNPVKEVNDQYFLPFLAEMRQYYDFLKEKHQENILNS